MHISVQQVLRDLNDFNFPEKFCGQQNNSGPIAPFTIQISQVRRPLSTTLYFIDGNARSQPT